MTRRRLSVLASLGLALALGAGWLAARQYVQGRLDAALDDLRPGLDVTYAGWELDLARRGLALTGLSARAPDGAVLRAERALFLDLDLEHRTPYFLRAAFTGVTAEDPAWGWRAPVCAVSVDYRYAPLERELTVDNLAVSQPDGFEVVLSGRFGNLDMDRFLDGLYFASSLASLDLRYQDRSLLARALKQIAGQYRTSPEALQAGLEAWLGAQEARARAQRNETAARALESLRRFAHAPGELTVRLAPQEPVPILYLMADGNLPEMLSLLNATIEAR